MFGLENAGRTFSETSTNSCQYARFNVPEDSSTLHSICIRISNIEGSMVYSWFGSYGREMWIASGRKADCGGGGGGSI
jgi:hypothetical protein